MNGKPKTSGITGHDALKIGVVAVTDTVFAEEQCDIYLKY